MQYEVEELEKKARERNPNNIVIDLEQRQVDMFNNRKLPLDILTNCKECNGSGEIGYKNSYGRFAIKKCKCFPQVKTNQKLKSLGLLDFIKEVPSLDNLPEKEDWELKVKQRLQNYVSNYNGLNWLFIGGAVGSGKTTKAVIVSKELQLKNPELTYEYFNWDTRYKELIYNKDTRDELLYWLQNVDILYLDDFFRHQNGELNENEREKAKAVIDFRYIKKKVTIITSELYITEIRALDEAIGSRIYQMCNKSIYTIQIKRDSDRNYRDKEMGEMI